MDASSKTDGKIPENDAILIKTEPGTSWWGDLVVFTDLSRSLPNVEVSRWLNEK